jgi:DNA-binding response OmpR family regulator
MPWTPITLGPAAPSRILYVEDDDALRAVITAVLVREGYEVVGARTAEVGCEELSRSSFGLLITDYDLPGASGGWLLGAADARGVLPDGGAIVVSSAPRLTLGSTLVLPKPIDMERLLAEVAGRLVVSTPPPECRYAA